MVNKKIQKKRTMIYFINSAYELMNEGGLENVTIRKVANRAGYNSATLYNYFENLDHLIFLASMKNIKDYVENLPKYIKDAKNSMDIFLKVWQCFCDYSYNKPEIYTAIFFSNLDKHVEHYVAEYYTLFPEELLKGNESISTMLLKSNIDERGMAIMKDCVKDGYIKKEDANDINDMTLLIYEGILRRVLKGELSYDHARNITMNYIEHIMKGFLIKDYEFYYCG